MAGGAGVPKVAPMIASVLGPVEVRSEGRGLDLGTPKQRALLTALALYAGRPVPVDTLVDLLWADSAPSGVATTLQAYVSGLRRVLEPERERRAPARVLVTAGTGYALHLPTDAETFDRTIVEAHREVQPLGLLGGPGWDPAALAAVVTRLDDALALWRGEPYADLVDAEAAAAERVRLDELRLVAAEDRAVAGLALGRHQTVAAELGTLVRQHPLRERLWGLQALALTRSGRQAEALDTLRRVREVLDEELGLDPSPELRDLQGAILRQDPVLDWVAPQERISIPVPRPAPEDRGAGAPWPMVGRDAELGALLGALHHAATGTPAYAVITGDPGIGKSRLVGELASTVTRQGTRVLVGRCSQDDGAPPLWPWRRVLEGLGLSLESLLDGEGTSQFRVWERITSALLEAAAGDPVVVVLDDLHWSDPSSLRVLRLLIERATAERLLVVAIWRRHPEPAGELAATAEALARAHALRLELAGLARGAVADVVAAVGGVTPSPEQAGVLRERTDGNPFFLVEYARLAGTTDDLAALLAEERPPTAVAEVIARRVATLPEPTRAALRSAAVMGRRFDGETLAALSATDADDVLDVLEPAVEAGLVREDGIERFLFAHALVRDTLYAGISPGRRARTHARIAATLAGGGGRETEIARHWRSAGPAHAAKAWPAALAAAGVARRLHAHDEAAELIRCALVSLDDDPAATPRARYHVLMQLVEACRWAADLPALVAAVEEAIAVGKALHDPEAVARAAIATTQSVIWRSAGPGEVNDVVVAALRASLERLPEDDGELRCRTLLALANELEEALPFPERRRLIEDALAMAERLADPALLLDAGLTAHECLDAPASALDRLGWVTRAVELARSTGNERSLVVAGVMRAIVLSQLGRADEMRAAAERARADAERVRLLFGTVILDGLLLPWDAMAGRLLHCEETIDRMRATGRQLAHIHVDEAILAATLSLRLWQGRAAEMVPALQAFDSSMPYAFAASVAVYLWRSGDHDAARAWYAEHGAPLDHENQVSMLAWCHAAELALYLGDAGLGAGARDRLAAYQGYSCHAGSALAGGPVDAYLALAAAATGDPAAAAAHADGALRLAQAWDLHLFADWFADTRAAYRF